MGTNDEKKTETGKEKAPKRNADGLLVCERCRMPRERIFPAGGIFKEPHKVPVMCACQTEEVERQKAEQEAAERRRLLEKRKAACFPSSGRYAFLTFDADDGRNPEQTSVCRAFSATFDPADPMGLVLYGDCGTGKSFHAACIANGVIEGGHSCLVTDIKQVVNLMESSFENRLKNLAHVLEPDLLILEDLGAQRSTEYVMEHVYDVVDGRYKAGKPMVITTNFDYRNRILRPAPDDPWRRVFDRIVECGYPVAYRGATRRKEIGAVNREAFRRKLGIAAQGLS